MAELTSRKDEELVVGAAQAVLDKYGADSDLSDLLERVRESDATVIFDRWRPSAGRRHCPPFIS